MKPVRLSLIGTSVIAGLISAWGPSASAGDFGASWTGDFARNLGGGLARDERHLGLVELTFDQAFALGGRDSTLHVVAQHVYGGGLTEYVVGDLQTVSNIDADRGIRLFEAWIDVPLSEHSSLLLGRYDLNGEFDAVEAGGLFLSSSQGIGPDISQTGAAGPSIYPRTAFGVRLQHADEHGGILRVAALDVEASAGLDADDTPFTGGPMFTLEYEWALPSASVKTGAWRFTRTSPEIAAPQRRDSQYGGYASIERRLGESFVAYCRLGVANDDVSRIGLYAGAGVVHTGGLLANRDDTLGLSIGYARDGSPYQRVKRADGIALASGEQAYELTWRIPFGEHLVLQPDVQLVIDPDSRTEIGDALVAILRVELAL